MVRLLISWLVVIPFWASVFEKNDLLNSKKTAIYGPANFPKETLEDVQLLMQQATGNVWTIVNDEQKAGIVLKYNKYLSYSTNESSQQTSDGQTYLKIEAYDNRGLTFGIYHYLRSLGFKFYLPDENYTIIPRIKNHFIAMDKMITPFQQVRTISGTGGFGTGKTDADKSVQKDWMLWQKRNGFGSSFSLAGHVGETFNLANAAILSKNPSWTATPIMKNGKVDVSTKLNYFNPTAIDFFTNWVLKKYTTPGFTPPPAYVPEMVSIEPADGGNYKTGSAKLNGTQLTTTSDQVYYSANEAARKLDIMFPNHPNIGVNLYAYSSHADIPSFPLNKRIFIQLIPYQFQNISFGPAFIKRWSEKTSNFGLYDYFRYPDASWDVPQGGSLDELMKRAIYAKQQGSKGTTYETSYSKFATGIPLWVLIRYMADGEIAWEKIYHQLINDLFGTGAPLVKEIFDMFYRSSSFNAPHLQSSLHYASQAETNAKDDIIKYRLKELQLYLSYIDTYFESLDENSGSLEQRKMPVYNIAWSLYENKILHSYRIMQLVSYGFLNAKTSTPEEKAHYRDLHMKLFPETTDKNAVWKNKQTPNSNKNLSMRPSQKNIPPSVKHENLTIEQQLKIAEGLFTSPKQFSVRGSHLNRGYFTLFTPTEKTISINWFLRNEKDKNASLTISGVDREYKAVYDFPLKGKEGNFTFTIPRGTTSFFIHASSLSTYKLMVSLNGAFVYFTPSPRGRMAFIDPTDKSEKNLYAPLYYPSWIFIPKNIKEISYKVQLNALKIFSPDGKQVQTTLVSSQAGGFEIRRFNPPPEQTGKFWKVAISGNYNYEMLNIPDSYFLLHPTRQ